MKFLYANVNLAVKVEQAAGTTVKTGIHTMNATQHIALVVKSARISKSSSTTLFRPGAVACI